MASLGSKRIAIVALLAGFCCTANSLALDLTVGPISDQNNEFTFDYYPDDLLAQDPTQFRVHQYFYSDAAGHAGGLWSSSFSKTTAWPVTVIFHFWTTSDSTISSSLKYSSGVGWSPTTAKVTQGTSVVAVGNKSPYPTGDSYKFEPFLVRANIAYNLEITAYTPLVWAAHTIYGNGIVFDVSAVPEPSSREGLINAAATGPDH